MKSLVITSSILALVAGSAMAEGLSYANAGLEYNKLTDGDNEATTTFLNGSVEFTTNQLLFSAFLESTEFEFEGFGSTSFQQYGAAVGYMITPEILAGLGVFGASFEGQADEPTGIEAFAQYQAAQFAVAVDYEKPDSDADFSTTKLIGEFEAVPGVKLGAAVISFSDIDVTQYRLSAAYDAGPIDVRGFYYGAQDEDFAYAGASGSYVVASNIRVLGSYTTFIGDNIPDLSTLTVGAGYQLGQNTWIDAEYGTFNGDNAPDNVDTFGLKFTFETGTMMRLDSRLAKDISEDQRNIRFFGFGPS